MTITYTTLLRGIEGNQRANYGTVTTTSSEGTLFIQTGLRIANSFISETRWSGQAIVPSPTSFPDRVDVSWFITVVKLSASDTLDWRAAGRT